MLSQIVFPSRRTPYKPLILLQWHLYQTWSTNPILGVYRFCKRILLRPYCQPFGSQWAFPTNGERLIHWLCIFHIRKSFPHKWNQTPEPDIIRFISGKPLVAYKGKRTRQSHRLLLFKKWLRLPLLRSGIFLMMIPKPGNSWIMFMKHMDILSCRVLRHIGQRRANRMNELAIKKWGVQYDE